MNYTKPNNENYEDKSEDYLFCSIGNKEDLNNQIENNHLK